MSVSRSSAWLRRLALLLVVGLVAAACANGEVEPDDTDGEVEDAEEAADSDADEEPEIDDDAEEDAEEPADADGEPIIVGAAVAQTGDLAAFGLLQQAAMEKAVEDVNEAGGVNGRPMELVIEDTGDEAPTGIAASQRVLARDPVALLGITVSFLANPLVDLIDEAGIPMLHGAQAPTLTPDEEGSEWYFRVRTQDDLTARSVFEAGSERVDFSAPAIIHSNDPVGTGYENSLRRLLEDNDHELVAVESHDLGPTDLTSQIQSVANADADILFVQNFPADSGLLARQMDELGLDIPVVWGASATYAAFDFGLIEPELIAGDIASLDAMPRYDPDEDVQAWAQELEEESDLVPNEQSVSFYSAILMLADAIERAGTTDPEPLRDALAETQDLTEWNGIALPGVVFDCDANQNCLRERHIYEVGDDGVPTRVATYVDED